MYLYSTRAACRRLRTGHIGLAHRHAAAAPAVAVLLVPFLSSAMQFRSAAAPVTPPLAQPRSPRGGGGASESRGNGGRRSVRCAFAASWERRRPRGRAFHPLPARPRVAHAQGLAQSRRFAPLFRGGRRAGAGSGTPRSRGSVTARFRSPETREFRGAYRPWSAATVRAAAARRRRGRGAEGP